MRSWRRERMVNGPSYPRVQNSVTEASSLASRWTHIDSAGAASLGGAAMVANFAYSRVGMS